MNIDDLTFKQIKELNELFGLSTTNKKYPVEVGKAYFFRTVTHYELGIVESITGQFSYGI